MFLWKMFRPQQVFPGLQQGSGRSLLGGLYKLKHRFSGYDIDGSFDVRKGKTSNVYIKYIEKTDQSGGFGKLLEDLEQSATQGGSTDLRVTFEQSKPEVVDKLKKHSGHRKFDYGEEPFGTGLESPFGEEGGTGPNVILTKKLDPTKNQ